MVCEHIPILFEEFLTVPMVYFYPPEFMGLTCIRGL
jgi:hypothetical protein